MLRVSVLAPQPRFSAMRTADRMSRNRKQKGKRSQPGSRAGRKTQPQAGDTAQASGGKDIGNLAPSQFPNEAAEIRRLISRGKHKSALDRAKTAHRQEGTAESEALLVDAYIARIEGMLGSGMAREASALMDIVRSKYPASGSRLDGLVGTVAGRTGKLDDLLAPLIAPSLSKERRASIEAAIMREVADPACIAECRALPEDHPLRQSAAAITKAFTAVTRGPVSDDDVALPEVPRRSPLAPWKALIRAIACFYRSDDEGCEKWLTLVAPDSAPARLAPAMRTMIGTASSDNLGPKAIKFVAKVGGDLGAMRMCAEAFDRTWPSGKVRQQNSAIRGVLKACAQAPASMANRIRQHLYVRCTLAKRAPVAIKEVAKTSFPEDAYFWRLCARAHETLLMPFRACALWELFRRAAVKEGWFTEASPQAAALFLHMAGLLAPVQPKDLAEVQYTFFENNEYDPSFGIDPVLRALAGLCDQNAEQFYFLYPERLYERAAQVDPDPDTFQQWLSWTQEHTQGWRFSDDVAQRWRSQFPDDVRPLLHLMESTEKRNALKKALGYLEEAERIDRLSPDVRRARLRLLAATTLRHLKQKKPHLAEKDFAAIDALPEAKEGDRPVLVDALRWVCAALQGDADRGAALCAKVQQSLSDDLAAIVVLEGVAKVCGLTPNSLPPLPDEPALLPMGVLAPAVARGCALGDDLGVPIDIPRGWETRLAEDLVREDADLDPAHLRSLAEAALRRRHVRLAYAAGAAGLALGGATRARFLLLKARCMPLWAPRRERCLAAAATLARQQRDMGLVDEAVECLHGPGRRGFGWLPAPELGANQLSLDEDKLAQVIQQETLSRAYKAAEFYDYDYADEWDDDEDDFDAVDVRQCNCPECRRRRGEIVDDDDDDWEDEDEYLDDEGDMFGGMGDLGPSGFPPGLDKVFLELLLKHGKDGVPDLEKVARTDPSLIARALEAMMEAEAEGLLPPPPFGPLPAPRQSTKSKPRKKRKRRR